MRRFSINVIASAGGPSIGAQVRVYLDGTTTPASLFQDDGIAINQPIITDDNGYFEFNVASGVYDLEVVRVNDSTLHRRLQLDSGS